MFCRFTPKYSSYLSRFLSTTSHLNVKVTVVGAAGGIGQPLSLLLKQSPLIDELVLYDIANTPGVTADIAHINTPVRVTGFHGKEFLDEALHQSDIIMISAGMECKPGMKGDDLFDSNASIVYEMGTAIASACPQAIVGLITNPVNSCVPVLCEVLIKEKKFDPRRIIGVTTLDEVRAATLIGIANDINPSSLNVPVVGGHYGTTIVPLLSQCNPTLNISDKLAKQITEDIREAGTKIVLAKNGNGSASLATAWAGALFTIKLVKALKGDRSIVTCGYVMSDVCNTKYFALPLLLGRCGVEISFGIPAINDFEHELVYNAIPELKKNVEKGIEFVKNGKINTNEK